MRPLLLLLLGLGVAAAAAAARRPEELEPEAAASVQPQCEPIATKLCESMPYGLTRMPNFFGDQNQFEAHERSLAYAELVASQCSPHLLTYLCELLNPICISQDAQTMRRFEIFPCRSFCRRLWRDCERQLASLRQARLVARAFQCEQLPFEANEAANGSSPAGPCHELDAGARPQPDLFRPYQAQADFNKPPYITDTSRLSPKQLEPAPRPAAAEPPPISGNGGLFGQVGAWGAGLALALVKYSNQLSVLTLVCLLLVLNLRRLRSWTRARSPPAAPKPGPAHPANRPNSPSSSSRSLVLFAAGAKGQPAAHHQLLGQQPSQLQDPQRLLHGLSHQKTLIRLDGSLERPRYLLSSGPNQSQAPDKQHLFGTLDSAHSSCHSPQYDYIQVGQPPSPRRPPPTHQQPPNQLQQQQQQQLYSNILLSSPSHQVLLVGGPNPPQPRPGQWRGLDGAPSRAASEQRSFQRRRAAGGGARASGRRANSSWSSSSGSSSLSPPDVSLGGGCRPSQL